MALPPPTPEGRAKALEALRYAQATRKDVLERLGKGLRIEDVIEMASHDTPHGRAVGKLELTRCLEAMPGIGEVGARNALSRLDIPLGKRLSGVGGEQAERLSAMFA